MYLKNLTVLGFKSFADKTSLTFQPGVTAIVGPNGCGKSNVSDAIRWVLGEQSAKALRGGEMADVIFNGTDGRKPLGMAEVSLAIGDVDSENLSAAGVEMAYNEITLTRRVFRDGNSEYFINKTPCRLKDVQQLFMGTGVGRASYSIMAQGDITHILSSKPEDRRIIFEEAAGITKYKTQKKESLRKLEYTDQNLLRVSDLIREVKRQIVSLQRQAGKARRYKQLLQEMQHLDTQLARHQFDLLQAEINERQSAAQKLHAEIENLSTRLQHGEEEIARQREQLSAWDHEISQMQQRGMELKNQLDRHESRIQFNEERLRELTGQNAQAHSDITQAEERRRVAEEEATRIRERLSASESGMQTLRVNLQEKQTALQNLEERIRRDQEELREAQVAAFATAQELTRARNEIAALDVQKQGNVVRLEKLSAEKIQLEEERARLEDRLREFSTSVEAEKLSVRVKGAALEQRQRRLRELQTELQQCSTEQDQYLQAQAEKRSRLTILEQLEGSREGFDAGTLAALRRSRSVMGSLADRIRVPDEFVVAIENALGHYLQLVLTERPESAQKVLADLVESKAGRASVAALSIQYTDEKQLGFAGDMAPHGDGRTLKEHLAKGEVIPALSVVNVDPSVDTLLKSLLGRTFIAPDLPTATEQIQNGHAGCDFVTLNGDLLSRHGVYTGGYLNGNGNPRSPGSILGRKNQITDLQAEVEELKQLLEEASRRRGALLSEQTELQAGLQQAQTDLRDQEVAVATREGEFKALESSQRVLLQKIETVIYEIQCLAAQEQEGRQKRADLVEFVNKLEQREQACQARVEALTSELESLRHQRDAANALVTESKVALATEEQLHAALCRQQQPLEERIKELTQLLEQRRREVSSFVSRKEQAEAEILESRRQIELLRCNREQLEGQVAALTEKKASSESELRDCEDGVRECRRQLTELQERRRTIEVELAQKHMGVQNLRERIQQRYHVNLDDVRSECITITFADEGPAKVHVLTPEEMAKAGAATDWTAVAQQIETLQKRLDEMGPVNLVAIEEYEETEQRYQFLSKQHDDLVQAKSQLLEVINRINTQTEQMFAETFQRIRENFRVMFKEVFGGGKADLILLDENNALESGIEIVARPPGKQLQTISLLSGGEQTMVAVALLFSIYQVRPSPFCVLDELDAALDEANINRFVRLVQRFLARSQFIIITHNKRTIGMADVLYGVTMEEHGVSKIISVKFHKTADGSESGKPLVPLPTGRQVEEEEDALQGRDKTLDISLAQ